jgi:hypothetical protein
VRAWSHVVLEERRNTSTIGTFDLECGAERPVQDVESLGLNACNTDCFASFGVLFRVCSLYQDQVTIFELHIVGAELHINSYARIVGWASVAIDEELVCEGFCLWIGQDILCDVGVVLKVIVDAMCVLFARCETPSAWTFRRSTGLDKVKDGEENVNQHAESTHIVWLLMHLS